MKNSRDGIGKTLAHALRLSPDEAFERQKADEFKRAAYRRAYWQKYSKRVRRVYGTLTPEEYAAIAARAAACQEGTPSIWKQLRDEAFAHVNNHALPSAEIVAEQRKLIAELRRIGNNLNQLAKLGHIRAIKGDALTPRPGDDLGLETLRQFKRLEAKIVRFDDAMNGMRRDVD